MITVTSPQRASGAWDTPISAGGQGFLQAPPAAGGAGARPKGPPKDRTGQGAARRSPGGTDVSAMRGAVAATAEPFDRPRADAFRESAFPVRDHDRGFAATFAFGRAGDPSRAQLDVQALGGRHGCR